MIVASAMLLTSVLVCLLAGLTCSTPIFIVDEHSNIYIIFAMVYHMKIICTHVSIYIKYLNDL